MKMKSLLAIAFVAMGITACSTVNKVVYRIDVPQGNYLEAATVAQNDPIRRTLLVYFDNQGFVKDIKLDDIKDQKIVEEKVE